jgi:hypothetical protein
VCRVFKTGQSSFEYFPHSSAVRGASYSLGDALACN